MQDQNPSRNRRNAGIVMASAGLGGVFLLGSLIGSYSAGQHLTPAATDAVESVPGATVTFAGREATVTGPLSPSQQATALDAVERVNGVRWATYSGEGARVDSAPVEGTTPTEEPTAESKPADDNGIPGLSADESARLAALIVLFEPDSAVVTPAGSNVLDELVELLEATPDARITVTGYSAVATLPTDAEIAFSASRAQAAADYLAAEGIDADRLTVTGAGVVSSPGLDPANRKVTFTESKDAN